MAAAGTEGRNASCGDYGFCNVQKGPCIFKFAGLVRCVIVFVRVIVDDAGAAAVIVVLVVADVRCRTNILYLSECVARWAFGV